MKNSNLDFEEVKLQSNQDEKPEILPVGDTPKEEVESVRFSALTNSTHLKTPDLMAMLTINDKNFEVGDPTDRFITTIDNLFEKNPHGKVTIEQLTRAYNASSSNKSGLTDIQIEEMRNMIDIYRSAVCVFSYGDDIITTIDNHLVDITRETKQVRINNKLVDEHYYIHRPSLVKLVSEQYPRAVKYFKIPYNWLDLGFRATNANNALIFLLSKSIATHKTSIDLDRIYKIVNATTPKQQLDTRKKIRKILDYHRDEKVITPLHDYIITSEYDQSYDFNDPTAKTIELQYKDDDGE
jgi:hypothetical protein